MKVNMICMYEVSHTKELSPSHTLPLSLTYLLPLPLWRQAPKSKGLKVGLEQTSQALEYGERYGTMKCHPQTLDSVLWDLSKLAAADP
jgi:hypothetical protein